MKYLINIFNILTIFMVLVILGSCGSQNVSVTITGTQAATPLPSVSPQAATDEAGQTSRPLIVVKPEDEMQIYVRADGAPGMYLGEDNQVHGFYVDMEKMLMKEMGQKYRFVPYDNLGPVAQKMKSGEAHTALACPDVPDYRAIANLSDSFEVLSYFTFVKQGDTSIKGNNRDAIIKSLSGKKVGVQVRGHIYQVLRDFKDITLVEYPTTTLALKDLAEGKLDAVPDVRENGIYYAKKNGWKIEPVGEPIIRHKDTTAFSKALDPSLMKRYNAALRAIIADGRFKKLWESYFAN